MSDSEDEVVGDPMERGRVARFFLFKDREKQAVRRTQMKNVLNQYREKSKSKRKDPIREADQILHESLGLEVVYPQDKGTKYFIRRRRPYPSQCELPFTEAQKREYGLMMFAFFIIYFKGEDGCEVEQLKANLEQNSGLSFTKLEFRWPDIVQKWASEDYVKITKVEDDADPTLERRMVTLGPRFEAEFGTELLMKMAKELIFDEAPTEEEDDDDDEEEEKGEKQEEAQEAEEPPQPPPKERRSKRKSRM